MLELGDLGNVVNMSKNHQFTVLESAKKEVFSRRSQLSKIYEEFGHLSLKQYVKDAWEAPVNPLDPLFLKVLKNELDLLNNKTQSAAICRQIASKPIVSTIDHLGIWNHPIYVNSDLIYSQYFGSVEFLPVFATESVSLNNTSSWSGCLLRHNENLKQERFSFFPDRLKNLPVFSAPAFGEKELSVLEKKLPSQLKPVLKSLGAAKAAGLGSFSKQAAFMSSYMWKAVFPSAPKLVVVGLESLMTDYLLEIFKLDKHFISWLVLNPSGQKAWNKYFPREHTRMFWGINDHGRRVAVNRLPAAEGLLEGLRNRKFYPSSTLGFILLLNAGLTCVGGFTQTTWLTAIKQQLLDLLSFEGLDGEISRIQKIPTRNFAEGSLSVLKKQDGFFSPTAVDLFLLNKDMYFAYQKLAENLTLKDSINLAIPTIYRVVVPQNERRLNLDNVFPSGVEAWLSYAEELGLQS